MKDLLKFSDKHPILHSNLLGISIAAIVYAMSYMLLHNYIKSVLLVFFLWMPVGVLFIILENIIYNRHTKKAEDYSYNIDYKLELLTYNAIGKKKVKRKSDIQKFSKYTEWKKYLEEKHRLHLNHEDAYHYMLRKLRIKESFKDAFISLLVPFEIGIISIFFTLNMLEKNAGMKTCLCLMGITFFTMGILISDYQKCKNEIYFINDFIDIIFPQYSEKT